VRISNPTERTPIANLDMATSFSLANAVVGDHPEQAPTFERRGRIPIDYEEVNQQERQGAFKSRLH
jgi:hypothetical protein